MLKILTNTHRYHYELSNITRLFFDGHVYENDKTIKDHLGSVIVLDLIEAENEWTYTLDVWHDGQHLKQYHEELSYDQKDELSKRQFKRKLLKSFYLGLHSLRNKETPWGILTGVRPVKLVHEFMDSGLDSDIIKARLFDDFCISKEKVDLLLSVAQRERELIFPVEARSYSLYVGIPFCPSRCSYCSFPSHGSAHTTLVETYFKTLIKELEGVLPLLNPACADGLYIGGGTPSILSASQVKVLLNTIDVYIPIRQLTEVTFEAGRPETINTELLLQLREFGIDRICLNPQTFKDKTLAKVGRTHSSADILEAYQLIRSHGFGVINMDLIAGLPDETIEDWKSTLQTVLALNPENITVHTLALKSGAALKNEGYATPEHLVSEMVHYAQDALKNAGYSPYYLYRQKYIGDNLENVGYAKWGTESRYNMQIMEERQSIIAFGVGAVSKMIQAGDRFERVANPRDIELYNKTIDQIVHKKNVYIVNSP